MSDLADIRWHILNDIMSQYYLRYHRIFWLNALHPTPPSSPSPMSYHTASSEPVNPHPAPNFAALSDDDLEHMLLKLGYDPDPTLPKRVGGTAYHHYAHAENPGRLRRDQEVDERLQPLLTSPSAEQCIRLSRALTALKDRGIKQDVARYQAWYRCMDRLRRFRDELTRILHERELEFILIANRLENADTFNRLVPHLATPYHVNVRTGGLRGGSSHQPPSSRQPPLPRGPKCWHCKRYGHRHDQWVQFIASTSSQPRTSRPRRTPRCGTLCVRTHRGACTYDCHFCPSCRVDLHSGHCGLACTRRLAMNNEND